MNQRLNGTLGLRLSIEGGGGNRLKPELGVTGDSVVDALQNTSIIKAGFFSFKAFIENRSPIALSDLESEALLGDAYDNTKKYFFRVPKLLSGDTSLLRNSVDRDKIRIQIKKITYPTLGLYEVEDQQ